MELKLTNGKVLDVKFWSFLKCYILSALVMAGIIYAGIGLIFLILILLGILL